MEPRKVSSGLLPLDLVIQGLRLGDNVVWQVDRLEEYSRFALPFAERAIADCRRCVYLRFAPHPRILPPLSGLETIDLDPHVGFDAFSGAVHSVIEAKGEEVFYVFDNLSALVVQWATDELLANFFQVTCPYLFELRTVAYFALTRGRHAHAAVARVRDTTQVLIDVYHVKGELFIHPLKVWDRYSHQMFLPHRADGMAWLPVYHGGENAVELVPVRSEGKAIAPWESVYAKLRQYLEEGETSETGVLKQELSRMTVGGHAEFNRLADSYLTTGDLIDVRERMIGSGRIGGKAAGMLLARRILLAEAGETDFSRVLEPHDSFYIGSDVFFTFLVDNDLFRTRLQMTRSSRISDAEFEDMEHRFLAGRFPPEIMDRFRSMLEYFGEAPIIVRSSSLLEDSFGNAFAGKYRSEYCANQGSLEQRLAVLLRAVKLVYASALNPDALAYRRERGLGESDEQMAILVQRVSGIPYKQYFFPSLAGVAFSRNLYAWSDRIDAAKGMIRLVFGLGTRAVNRVGNDYPRMIAVSHPALRPEFGTRVVKYSQWDIDLLDLRENQFLTKPLAEVLAEGDYPNLPLFVSLMADGYLYDPVVGRLDNSSKKFVLTFNNLLGKTNFVALMGEMLARLEKAYGHPLDTEFTASVDARGGVRINLLQCRPMRVPGLSDPVTVPAGISRERILFRSGRTISGGVVSGIRHILYIDPKKYAGIASLEIKKSVGRLVGQINDHPRIAPGKIMMMGPGRWGSSNIDLGVNVSYADISNTSVLVEIAREEAGHVPEVSYGTHFFLDLVEARIVYLPVYPNDPVSDFNDEFFARQPNILCDLLPGREKFLDLVHVFDLPAATGGMHAKVVADPERQKAVCYLE